jgi:hypothetical protein
MNLTMRPGVFAPWTTPSASRANQPNSTVPPEPQSDAISDGGSDVDKRVQSIFNLLRGILTPKSFIIDETTQAKLDDLLLSNEHADVEPIASETVNVAKQFLCEFRELINATEHGWRVPRIASDGNGDIAIEWWKDGRALIFSIVSNGDIEYLEAWGPNINEQMEEGVNPDSDLLVELWEKLHTAN